MSTESLASFVCERAGLDWARSCLRSTVSAAFEPARCHHENRGLAGESARSSAGAEAFDQLNRWGAPAQPEIPNIIMMTSPIPGGLFMAFPPAATSSMSCDHAGIRIAWIRLPSAFHRQREMQYPVDSTFGRERSSTQLVTHGQPLRSHNAVE
jgi:hypothetical protein